MTTEAWDRLGCHQRLSALPGDVPCGVSVNWEIGDSNRFTSKKQSSASLEWHLVELGPICDVDENRITLANTESRAQIIEEVEVFALLGCYAAYLPAFWDNLSVTSSPTTTTLYGRRPNDLCGPDLSIRSWQWQLLNEVRNCHNYVAHRNLPRDGFLTRISPGRIY
jgi:hypothetical protein